jgi:hypothetical protein
MLFDEEPLFALDEQQLLGLLDWTRVHEKDARRAGEWGIARAWGSCGHQVVMELSRRWNANAAAEFQQLYLQ